MCACRRQLRSSPDVVVLMLYMYLICDNTMLQKTQIQAHSILHTTSSLSCPLPFPTTPLSPPPTPVSFPSPFRNASAKRLRMQMVIGSRYSFTSGWATYYTIVCPPISLNKEYGIKRCTYQVIKEPISIFGKRYSP